MLFIILVLSVVWWPISMEIDCESNTANYNLLRKQIVTLIEKRDEDLKLIQDGLIDNVLRNPDFVNLRNEIEFLKYQLMDTNKNNNKLLNTKLQLNDIEQYDQLTRVVDELKSRLGKIETSMDSTIILQNHQEIDAELSLLRNDVSTLLKDVALQQNHLQALEIRDQKPIKNLNNNRYERVRGNEIEKYRLINEETLAKFERKSENFTIEFDKIRNQLQDLQTMRNSTVSLLEKIESIETEIDTKTPRLQNDVTEIDASVEKVVAIVKRLNDNDRQRARDFEKLEQQFIDLMRSIRSDNERYDRLRDRFGRIENALFERNRHLYNHISKTESIKSKETERNQQASTPSSTSLPFVNNHRRNINPSRELPSGCDAIDDQATGVYDIVIDNESDPIRVRCDRGWTIIQTRIDGKVNFNRNWSEYANGFGDVNGEYWLGNRNLHLLTNRNCTVLDIRIVDIYGRIWTARYHHFRVGDYSNGYQLEISGFTGNVSDALAYHNHMEFSTFDNDRDTSSTHCANNYEGGWWFSHCQNANLNGKYNLGLTWFNDRENEWIAVKQSQMRVRQSASNTCY